MGNSKAKTQDEEMRTASCFLFELETSVEEGDHAIYLAGNFNDWHIHDERFQLTRTAPGHFELCIPLEELPPVLEYKYHRGSWDEVELDQYGNEVSNRMVTTEEGHRRDIVVRWKTSGRTYPLEFLPRIQVISDAFEIPQLIKTRRIAALLPYDYDTSDKRYPVLYLQDGQNLFDDYAPFGSWGVDKKLAIMAERGTHELIIIAIDHAEDERIEEFTPSYRTRLGVGQGKKYVSFLADTLKPYVDSHFRTLPERENTGIGGSSMGGLISIYAGLMYPNIYSKLMIFSPSLWVAPNIHFHAIQFQDVLRTKVYLYGGGAEGANVIPNIQKLKAALEKQGQDQRMQFELAIDPNGEHNEKRWGEEFPRAIEWLYFDKKN
ncbi:alpha/beta hydrolase [Flavilitoribacter nigricans]|nr:alpha/beta hydrolase-fold protein [Flavilitoribacter nigricans]